MPKATALLTQLKVLAASSIGGGLELYDFIIYVIFSNIIATLYFPKGNHYINLLATFGIFAIGYFMRPIGGFIFGHFGDKTGRKKWLIVSIIMMGFATVAIGFIPTYEKIGIAAPILLTLCRLLQGIAVGGDLPGGVTFVSEHANVNYRGINCAIVFCGVNVGLLLASAVGTVIISLLTHQQLYSWGWRIGFWFSAILIMLGLYLRFGLHESTVFLNAVKNKTLVKNPLVQLFHKELFPQAIMGMAFVWLFAVLIIQIFTKIPDFLEKHSVAISLDKAMLFNTISLTIFACLIPLMGYLSDIMGRKKLLIIGSVLWILFAYPAYKLLLVNSTTAVMVGIIMLDIMSAIIVGTVPAVLTELFSSSVRYSGVAFSYNMSSAIFGGLTPLLLTWLSHSVHDQALQSLNIIVGAIMCFIAALFMKDKRKMHL